MVHPLLSLVEQVTMEEAGGGIPIFDFHSAAEERHRNL